METKTETIETKEKIRDIKNHIIRIGNKMLSLGLVASTWGNISVKDRDTIYITPSGMEYEDLVEADIVALDLKGEILEGKRKPSSE